MRPVAIGSRAEHGSSMRMTSGSTRQGPGDAQPLLLAARQPDGRRLQPVLHLVPQRRAAAAIARRSRRGRLLVAHPRQPGTVGDVVVDRLRERVRLLEHHPDAPADLDGVDLAVVEVDAVVGDRALDPGPLDEVVHPVEAAQHRGLAAARGPDERGDLVPARRSRLTSGPRHGPVADAEVPDVEDDLSPIRASAVVVCSSVTVPRWIGASVVDRCRSRSLSLTFSSSRSGCGGRWRTPLRASTTTSITTMAAPVSALKPGFGSPAHVGDDDRHGGEPLPELFELEQPVVRRQPAGDGADQDQRRRLAEGPGEREHRAGEDAGRGVGQHVVADHLPAGGADAEAGLAEALGHGPDRLGRR